MDHGQFFAQVLAQQTHEEINFSFRAAPILHRKRIQGEGRDIEPSARFNDRPSRLHTSTVPRDSRQVAPLRPAPIAVHDHGDVLREPLRVQISKQALFFAGEWFERVQYFHAITPENST